MSHSATESYMTLYEKEQDKNKLLQVKYNKLLELVLYLSSIDNFCEHSIEVIRLCEERLKEISES